MCFGTEESSYLRLTDSCITRLKADGPSRTCKESKEEDEDLVQLRARAETVQLGGAQLPDAPRLRLGRLSIPLYHLRHLWETSFKAHRCFGALY